MGWLTDVGYLAVGAIERDREITKEDLAIRAENLQANRQILINQKQKKYDKELEEWILSMRVDGTKKFNIQATPSFVINGEVHSGNMPFSKFEKLLN